MVIDAFIVANHPGKIKPGGATKCGNRGFSAIGEKRRGNYAQTVDKFGDNTMKDWG